MTAPPIKRPMLRPITVTNVSEDGLSAWTRRMRRAVSPLARAIAMKSSCKVEIMSLRSTRIIVGHSSSASVAPGRIMARRLPIASWENGT
jgi:hypothetical protein